MAQLITFYTKTEEDEADRGTAARAGLLTQDDTIPLELRRFYGRFSKAERLAQAETPASYKL